MDANSVKSSTKHRALVIHRETFRNGNPSEIFCDNLCSSQHNEELCFHCSRDFYKDRLTEKELDDIENPTTAAPKKSKRPSRPQRKRPARVEEDDDA